MKARVTILIIALNALVVVSSAQAQFVKQASLTTLAEQLSGAPTDCTAAAKGGCGCASCRGWAIWGNAEYLMWWSKGRTAPPLITTSPGGTPQADAGVVGEPTTLLFFGGGRLGQGLGSGGRVTVGGWMDRRQDLGLGASFMGISLDESRFARSSNGQPIIARPFFNVIGGAEDALLVAFPGVVTGDILGLSETKAYGADGFFRLRLHEGCGYAIDMTGGYQFNRLNDGLLIDSLHTIVSGGPFPNGTTLRTIDIFDTENEFHGGSLGLIGQIHRRRWNIRGLAKVALGNNTMRANINGSTTVTAPMTSPSVAPGGLLAMPTNIGSFDNDEIVFIPEVGFTVGYRLNDCVELTVGYSAIYWSKVLLAADQIDRRVNLSQANNGMLVGPPLPQFQFRETDFWMQGFTFGMAWEY